MRLELVKFPVEHVRFSKKTGYKDGVLDVHKEELLGLVLEDRRIASADLDSAFPKEQTRIALVRSVVEPRVKVSGPGNVFPGILGPVETVGEGRTHTLPGVTVMVSAQYRATIQTGSSAQSSGVVDMWGPGAITPFASTINLVLILDLVKVINELDVQAALQLAQFKVARRLAETTVGMTSENMDVFELTEAAPSLPRVVYILSCSTTRQSPFGDVSYYGLPIRESFPTFVHPNEFLDGALTADARRGRGNVPKTWGWMNNAVILELLREHGRRLNFLGVILQRTQFETEFGKQVGAACASQMARLLRADGAIITRESPSGNNLMDVMLTVQACERKGVKTVFLTPEYGGATGTEMPFLFYVPEANAMITTGGLDRSITLPAPVKVIGVKQGEFATFSPKDPLFSPWAELKLDRRTEITGGIDWLGHMNYTCKEY